MGRGKDCPCPFFLYLFSESNTAMTLTAERPAELAPKPLETEAVPEDPVFLSPRRWTREEYYRLGEQGFFGDERVELLNGEIWTLPPQKTPHFSAIRRTVEIMETAFGPNFEIRPQAPITLSDGTEPEPDVVVAPGSYLDYEQHHPTPAEVRLLVEVSDATLRKDRMTKAEDYARAGIADYWIINLVHRQLEVFRDPLTRPEGAFYRTSQILLPGDSLAPLSAPDAPVAVADLLPTVLTFA